MNVRDEAKISAFVNTLGNIRLEPRTFYQMSMFPIRLGRRWQNPFYTGVWFEFWLKLQQDKRECLPPECPRCGEKKKLRIRIDTEGNSDAVECYAEGCGWDDYSSHESRVGAMVA